MAIRFLDEEPKSGASKIRFLDEPGPQQKSFFQQMEEYRKSIPYRTSPQGMMEQIPEYASKLSGRAGKFAQSQLQKDGVDPMTAKIIGGVIRYAPDTLFLASPESEATNIKKPVGKFFGQMGRIQSGVKPEFGERLFQDPGALLSPSTEEVGAKLGAVRRAGGLIKEPTVNEIYDTQGTLARRTARNAAQKLSEGKATPQDLLEGVRSTNKVIEATPVKQKETRRLLFEQKRKFSDALSEIMPEERKLSKEYARSALGGEFKKFFPVTKAGDVSITRTLGLGALEGSGKAGAVLPSLLQSPYLGGLGISAAGAASNLPPATLAAILIRRLRGETDGQ